MVWGGSVLYSTQRHQLMAELRRKYLSAVSSNCTPHTNVSTPHKEGKRIIQHSPTPRKVKIPSTFTPTRKSASVKPGPSSAPDSDQPKSSRKRLILSTATDQTKSQSSAIVTSKSKTAKIISPGKLKVCCCCNHNLAYTFYYP